MSGRDDCLRALAPAVLDLLAVGSDRAVPLSDRVAGAASLPPGGDYGDSGVRLTHGNPDVAVSRIGHADPPDLTYSDASKFFV